MWGCGDPGGGAAATVVLSGTRDCFLHLPPALASLLRLQQVPGRRRSGPRRRDGSGRQGGLRERTAPSPSPFPAASCCHGDTKPSSPPSRFSPSRSRDPSRGDLGEPLLLSPPAWPGSSSIPSKTREVFFPNVIWHCGHLHLSQHSLFHTSFPRNLLALSE